MTTQDLSAARRTVPTLSDRQWADWVSQVERLGGSIALPFDGGPCFATYPRSTPPCPHHASAIAIHGSRLQDNQSK